MNEEWVIEANTRKDYSKQAVIKVICPNCPKHGKYYWKDLIDYYYVDYKCQKCEKEYPESIIFQLELLVNS